MHVSEGGETYDAYVSAHGNLHVSNGGKATNTFLNGGDMHASDGAIVTNVSVKQGATLHVSAGATAEGILEKGGYVDLADGVDATFLANTIQELTLSNESATVHSMTKAVDITLANFGSLTVYDGGAATGTTVNGGRLRISSGGIASDTTVTNGDFLVSSGGKATGVTTIAEGRTCQVIEGGVFDFDISAISPANAALVNNLALVTGNPTFTLTVSDTQAEGTYILAGGSTDFGETISVFNTSGAELGAISVADGTKDIGGVKYTLALDGSDLSVTVGEGGESKIITGDVTSKTKDVPAGWTAQNVNVNVDGVLNILDGGKANNTTVNADGELNVCSGGVANNTTVDEGTVNIAGGGTANDATVKAYGDMTVLDGGTANNITLDGMSYLHISSGGVANDVTLAGGNARLNVHPGGTATGVVWTPGVGKILGGGLVTFANSYSGVYYASNGTLIESADTLDGRTFDSFDCEVYVTDGGKTTNTTLDAGFVYVWSGGVASNTTLNGGHLNVSSGGTAGDVNLLNGYAFISSGGVVSNAAVHAGAKQFEVYFGGKATGIMDFEVGAYISIQPGGVLDFDISALAPETVLLVNDLSIVQGTPDFTLTVSDLQADGKYSLAGGATGFDKTITVVNTLGATLGTISIADGTKDIGGVKYTLALDGSDLSVTIAGGVGNVITGNITDETKDVPAGWTALNVNVNENGKLNVLDGGKANNTNVNQNGMLYVISGGAASNTNVNSGGALQVYAGGTADGATVNPGGKAFVSSGTQKITENGGYVWLDPEATDVTFVPNTFEGITLVGGMCGSASVHSGTTAVNVTVNAGGELHVYDGGICSGGVLNVGGALDVYAGGTANGVTVNLGGGLYVSGGTADGVTVNSAGGLYVSGGAATNATVNSGSLCIYSDGEASNPTVNGGNLHVFSGGAATGVVWTPCAGHINIDEGGTATFATSYSGVYYGSDGKLLENAVTMDGKSVGDKCEMYVMEGGKATNAAVDDGGDVFVWSGGVASNTTLVNLGALYVSSGGVANDAAVNANGELFVLFGGVASNVTVGAGGYALVDGRIAGQMTFDAGAEVCVSSGGVIDFDVTGVAPSNAVLVNDLSVVTGKPSYTLTVDGTEATGTYNLAGNVTTFGNYIILMDVSGEDYGYLTIGGTVSNKYAYYTLAITDSTLTVDIVSKAASDTTPPTITVTPSTTEQTTSVTVSAVFSDDVAVATKQYRVGDGDWKDYTDPVPVTENVNVSFRATDTSGNSTVRNYKVTNIENEPENDELYNKKTKKWADAENIVTFSVNEVTAGDSMIYLDKKGSVESEDGKYFNSLGRTKTEAGTVEDAADYAKIELAYGAALSFSVDSTVGGTFYVYGTTKDKNDELVPKQRQKITVKANTTSPAKATTIYLEAGEYFVGMEGKLPSARKKPEVSAYYNVKLTGTKYFENADGGWNDHAYALDENGKEDKFQLDPVLKSKALNLERGVTFISMDDGAIGADDWVGFSDATDYRMLTLESKTNLTLSLTVTGTETGKGKAKLTIWKVSTNKTTGKITLTSKGSVTVKQGKSGSIKSKVLAAGMYFVSVASTDAKKGGDVSYNVKVADKTVFFDSADGDGVNKYVYKKKKLNPEIDKFRTNSIAVSGQKELFLDSNEIKLAGYDNFVGYDDKADYAKLSLASNGSVTFTIDTTGAGTFAVYRNNKDKSKLELVGKVAIKADGTTGEGHETLDIAELFADEDYYISMTAKSTKANSSGSVFYNVTAVATLSGSESSALVMPETDALAGASMDAYLDSASDKLFGETGNGLLASL
jgi:autotransporter passenger strand-loop-strand repeat protein